MERLREIWDELAAVNKDNVDGSLDDEVRRLEKAKEYWTSKSADPEDSDSRWTLPSLNDDYPPDYDEPMDFDLGV